MLSLGLFGPVVIIVVFTMAMCFARSIRDLQLRSRSVTRFGRSMLEAPSYVLSWRVVGAAGVLGGIVLLAKNLDVL